MGALARREGVLDKVKGIRVRVQTGLQEMIVKQKYQVICTIICAFHST